MTKARVGLSLVAAACSILGACSRDGLHSSTPADSGASQTGGFGMVAGGAGGTVGAGGSGGSGGGLGAGGAQPTPDAATPGCLEDGHTYGIGETFKRDCSGCICTEKGAVCTVIACADASNAGPDGPVTSDAAGSCFYGTRTYSIGETFSIDCNTCTCTTHGIACTAKACFYDARPDQPATPDATLTCALSANLTFGEDGGDVLYQDVNRLTAAGFTITRNYLGRTSRDGGSIAMCLPAMPACGAAGVVTVATINTDLADPDVQLLWTLPRDPAPFFGQDERPVDGPAYSIELDDGHKVLVGPQCASPVMSSCRYIPAGLVRLTQDLQRLAAAILADPACQGL
jgi:hypothetical protein